MSITETLRSLESASEDDAAYIIAAALNVYSESIRRRSGRILYGPGDIKNLLSILSMLLAPPELADQGYHPASRSAEPSDLEKSMLIDPVQFHNAIKG